jgi:hypothetical protein
MAAADGGRELTEDEVEDEPTGEHGAMRVNTMVVEARLEGRTTEGGPEVATRRGGGKTKRRVTMIGTGLTKGIRPRAISTEVAAAAATCTEGQAFKESRSVVVCS